MSLSANRVHNRDVNYERFFGLHDAPFSLAPNPQYFFESRHHASALQQLTDAIERREPLIVMTGEIGTGKTLLCRAVLQRFDRQTFVSVINDPLLDRDELLRPCWRTSASSPAIGPKSRA